MPAGDDTPDHEELPATFAQPFSSIDHFLYKLFFDISMMYVSVVSRSTRRIIEFFILLFAFLSFGLLVYAHMNFLHVPLNCLDHVKDIWPKHGILRVEIDQPRFQTVAKQRGLTIDPIVLNPHTKTNNDVNKGQINKKPSSEELIGKKQREDDKKGVFSSLQKNFNWNIKNYNFSQTDNSNQICKSSNNSINGISGMDSNLSIQSTTKPQPEANYNICGKRYCVEYSLEIGLLYLSLHARNRLEIPVMVVSLNTTAHKCFGNSVSQFFLEYFIGYDELLISSLKSLTIYNNTIGYMRNVITGQYYTFNNQKNLKEKNIFYCIVFYLHSFIIMVFFTVLISMFLKNYLVEEYLLISNEMNNEVFEICPSLRASPVVILMALYGLVNGMTLFFEDIAVAFYVLILILIAHLYYKLCRNSLLTEKHWPKFFFLYHFVFYAYYHRFYGSYKYLSIICLSLFIVHSMVYFYHIYELPSILQHEQLWQMVFHREDNLEQQMEDIWQSILQGNGTLGDLNIDQSNQQPEPTENNTAASATNAQARRLDSS